jgi:hypothetical protein
MKAEFLLSEEFADFSSKITALHATKKEHEAEFKKLYSEHKARIKAIDEQAVTLQQEFDNWMASNTKS